MFVWAVLKSAVAVSLLFVDFNGSRGNGSVTLFPQFRKLRGRWNKSEIYTDSLSSSRTRYTFTEWMVKRTSEVTFQLADAAMSSNWNSWINSWTLIWRRLWGSNRVRRQNRFAAPKTPEIGPLADVKTRHHPCTWKSFRWSLCMPPSGGPNPNYIS